MRVEEIRSLRSDIHIVAVTIERGTSSLSLRDSTLDGLTRIVRSLVQPPPAEAERSRLGKVVRLRAGPLMLPPVAGEHASPVPLPVPPDEQALAAIQEALIWVESATRNLIAIWSADSEKTPAFAKRCEMTLDAAASGQHGDQIPGPGSPRNEGDAIAPADAQPVPPAPADASGGEGGGGEGGGGEGGGGEGGGGEGAGGDPDAGDGAIPIPEDDREPEDAIKKITLSLALAEAMKPVATATDELHSLDPDKKKAREKVVSDYRKAAAQDGELDVRFKAADAAFIRTAEDMAGLFDAWLDRMTDTAADGAVAIAFRERQQVRERLDATRGDRERRRLRWQAETKLWESRFAAWKNPTANLTALMTDPAKINGLNADINNDKKRDLAMFAFWFEVAPKHLQLRGDPLPKKVAEQVAALQAALAPAPDLALGYDLGPDRDDGSLYLIDPDGLEQKRKEVLDAWTKAATAQAEAEAAFKLRPDDAASLGPRWDKLKDDGWVKAARTLLEAQDA